MSGLVLTRPSACRILGRTTDRVRDEPSFHQLLAIHPWFHGFRHVSQARVLKAAVRSVLLGSHDASSHRRVKVSCSLHFA